MTCLERIEAMLTQYMVAAWGWACCQELGCSDLTLKIAVGGSSWTTSLYRPTSLERPITLLGKVLRILHHLKDINGSRGTHNHAGPRSIGIDRQPAVIGRPAEFTQISSEISKSCAACHLLAALRLRNAQLLRTRATGAWPYKPSRSMLA